MSETKLIIQFALLSRLIVILLQAFANIVIPDHDANAFYSPLEAHGRRSFLQLVIDLLLGGFRRWDAEYLLHIAEHGYTYENMLAFYPLYPFCVRYITMLIINILSLQTSFRQISLFVAIALNVLFFVKAALTIHRLTFEIYKSPRMARIAMTLFCFNPASIFFSAPYTESLFCWLSFNVMLSCYRNDIDRANLFIVLSIWCRSNGILNMGFIYYYVIRNAWLNYNGKLFPIIRCIFKLILCTSVAIVSIALVHIYFYALYCNKYEYPMSQLVEDYGDENDFQMAGKGISEWCSYKIPFSYSYVQSYYWNVGFLRYYQIKQLPNFMIATPVLAMIIYHSVRYFINCKKYVLRFGFVRNPNNHLANQFIYIVHAFCLSIFCLLFIHVQVSTRMLASSSPFIYWICAHYYYNERHRKVNTAFLHPKTLITNCIKTWFLGYFVVGTVLFSNFLPWT